jgi:hypothetical protein
VLVSRGKKMAAQKKGVCAALQLAGQTSECHKQQKSTKKWQQNFSSPVKTVRRKTGGQCYDFENVMGKKYWRCGLKIHQ